jgi:hypothetical protein
VAYNRRNLLTRIIQIQEITLEHTNKGVTQKWVFDTIIKPEFKICERAYYKYLGINAKCELKKIESELKT